MARVAALLAADEPEAFTVLNEGAEKPVLLVCDHANYRIPRALGDMGLDPLAQRSHLALDIGAGALTEQLSASLAVTAVLASYSRLVVDCNRELMDPGAFLEYGDGLVIPGNRNLTAEQKEARAESLYWPYHRAIDREIKRLSRPDSSPAVIALHSFTPVLDGVSRPWEVGIMWDSDSRISDIMISGLAEAGLVVGDNEPYSGRAPQDFTIDNHAEAAGLPHVGIEVRQDLIDSDAGVREFALLLHDIITGIPPGTYGPLNAWPDNDASRLGHARAKRRSEA
ncbi:MAG: N-formylglutamate amidohydrolase [Woeseia sp.]